MGAVCAGAGHHLPEGSQTLTRVRYVLFLLITSVVIALTAGRSFLTSSLHWNRTAICVVRYLASGLIGSPIGACWDATWTNAGVLPGSYPMQIALLRAGAYAQVVELGDAVECPPGHSLCAFAQALARAMVDPLVITKSNWAREPEWGMGVLSIERARASGLQPGERARLFLLAGRALAGSQDDVMLGEAVQALQEAAQIAVGQGEDLIAEQAYQEGILASPRHAYGLYVEYGRWLLGQGESLASVDARFEEMRRISTRDEFYRTVWPANAWLRLESPDLALRYLELADSRWPDRYELVALWGRYYYAARRLNEAETHFRRAIALARPENKVAAGNAASGLAKTLQSQGRLEEALAAQRQVTEWIPSEAWQWVRLGEILEAMDRTAEARSAYQTALERQPDLEAARQALQRLD